MSNTKKNRQAILQKLGIAKLNPMQKQAQLAIHSVSEVVVLSPTGTGKTLAFLLPIMAELDRKATEIQAIVLVPSRELAIQIEQVIRDMGAGWKVNAVYGGRPFTKDKTNLQHRPAILVGTPGRVGDHLRRNTFSAKAVKFLVLDEFDKSLEIGFEEQMKDILSFMPKDQKRVLTSATHGVRVPDFVQLKKPVYINFLDEEIEQLQIYRIVSPEKDKLETLKQALQHIGPQPGILFCNYKDAIERVSEFLDENNIAHGVFHGGMEQLDRERALIKFRNGTHNLLVATDLAARGIDVPEIQFILHYHLPPRKLEFVHRNGRTARMKKSGTAYVLHWEKDQLPDFIEGIPEMKLSNNKNALTSEWRTLFISGGRKDKISKGDIAGLFFKQGGLEKDELGVIELKLDCAFVSVPKGKVNSLIDKLNDGRLKKRKIRVKEI